MKKLVTGILMLVITVVAFGQNKTDEKTINKSWNFHSLNQVGLSEGQAGSAVLLQTVNGMEYKNWFAGLGVGLDYYKFRTIPLFIDVRRKILNRAKSPFVYVDGGIGFIWAKEAINVAETDYKNGLYYDAGIGYTLESKKHNAFVLSIGYSEKRFVQTQYYPVVIDIYPAPPPYNNFNRYDYQLKRLSIKMGWKF